MSKRAKDLIELAASMRGTNASELTLKAAAKAARDTVSGYQLTVLKPEAHKALMEAFEATEPSNDLVALMSVVRKACS